MSLGEQIHKYRHALGLKLDHLAELTDVAPGTISALAVRSSDRSKYAGALARGLGLTLDELLDPTQDYTLKCFAHVDAHRPTGWEPSPELLVKINAASLRIDPSLAYEGVPPGTFKRHKVAETTTPHESTPTRIVWPFKQVTYARIERIRQYFAAPGMPPALSEIDKHLDILVARWENEITKAKSSAA